MNKFSKTFNEIHQITCTLIEVGLCDSYNEPIQKKITKNNTEITFSNDHNHSILLKNIPYKEMYDIIKKNKNYNISLADGAVLQLQYIFEKDEVIKHRLGFFPSPDLSEYQNCPELYDEEMVYAEITALNIVVTPMRFDFDKNAFIDEKHPMGHLTIGQYKNCRIPMNSPMSPFQFFDFILSSFYNTAYYEYKTKIHNMQIKHPKTITLNESRKVHINVGF